MAGRKKSSKYKAEGRVQDMLFKGSGLDECDKMWAELLTFFNAKFVGPEAPELEKYMSNVLAATWKLWGGDN